MPDPFEDMIEKLREEMAAEGQQPVAVPGQQPVGAPTAQPLELPAAITQDRPGWQWGGIGNPFSPDRWKQGAMNALSNLDFLDRFSVRPVRQPIIEAFRQTDFADPRSIAGLVSPGAGGHIAPTSDREQEIEQLYQVFQQKRGRPPSYHGAAEYPAGHNGLVAGTPW